MNDDTWYPASEAEGYNPLRYQFIWNEDYTQFQLRKCRWWDDASYIAYQSVDTGGDSMSDSNEYPESDGERLIREELEAEDARIEEALEKGEHCAYRCSCGGMFCRTCTAPSHVCMICNHDYEDGEVKCSGPRKPVVQADDDLPF